MKLLHLIFARLGDHEIRNLHPDILVQMHLCEKFQIELLGRVRDDIGKFIITYECSVGYLRGGWLIAKEGDILLEIHDEYKNGELNGEKRHGMIMDNYER